MPIQPTRFHATVRHYLRGRPAYAPALIRRVAQLCQVGRSDRVLDLGCGCEPGRRQAWP